MRLFLNTSRRRRVLLLGEDCSNYQLEKNLSELTADDDPPDLLNKFIEASTIANKALLEGKTFGEAYDLQWKAYDEMFESLVNEDLLAASMALENRDDMELLGDRETTAKKITRIPT